MHLLVIVLLLLLLPSRLNALGRDSANSPLLDEVYLSLDAQLLMHYPAEWLIEHEETDFVRFVAPIDSEFNELFLNFRLHTDTHQNGERLAQQEHQTLPFTTTLSLPATALENTTRPIILLQAESAPLQAVILVAALAPDTWLSLYFLGEPNEVDQVIETSIAMLEQAEYIDDPCNVLRQHEWEALGVGFAYPAPWVLATQPNQIWLSNNDGLLASSLGEDLATEDVILALRLAAEVIEVPLPNDTTPVEALIELAAQMPSDLLTQPEVQTLCLHPAAVFYADNGTQMVLHLAIQLDDAPLLLISALMADDAPETLVNQVYALAASLYSLDTLIA